MHARAQNNPLNSKEKLTVQSLKTGLFVIRSKLLYSGFSHDSNT